ncbi:unnamed protein product, partial [Didymodactylos carnosus]
DALKEKRLRRTKQDDDFIFDYNPGSQLASNPSTSSTSSMSLSFMNDTLNEQEEVFEVGDIVWARLNGHPWWPSLVYGCFSENGQHVKTVANSRGGYKRQYFVYYYGSHFEYSWIFKASLFRYNGLKNFIEHAESVVDQATTKTEQQELANRFQLKVSKRTRPLWDEAISEADRAMAMSKEKRTEEFSKLLDRILNGLHVPVDEERLVHPSLSPSPTSKARPKVEVDEESKTLMRKSSFIPASPMSNGEAKSYSKKIASDVQNQEIDSSDASPLPKPKSKAGRKPKSYYLSNPVTPSRSLSPLPVRRKGKRGRKPKNVLLDNNSSIPLSNSPVSKRKSESSPVSLKRRREAITTNKSNGTSPTIVRPYIRGPYKKRSHVQISTNNQRKSTEIQRVEVTNGLLDLSTAKPSSQSNLQSPAIKTDINDEDIKVLSVLTKPTCPPPPLSSSLSAAIYHSLEIGIPALTTYEEIRLAEDLINHEAGKQLTFEQAQAYITKKATDIVNLNHHYHMTYVQPEYFYDFLLKNPQVIIKHRQWFENIKSSTMPLNGNTIELKRWQLVAIVKTHTASEQQEQERKEEYDDIDDEEDNNKQKRNSFRRSERNKYHNTLTLTITIMANNYTDHTSVTILDDGIPTKRQRRTKQDSDFIFDNNHRTQNNTNNTISNENGKNRSSSLSTKRQYSYDDENSIINENGVIPSNIVPDTFEEGEIVWARLGGYPWWPALIFGCHTENGIYTKTLNSGNISKRQYFVYFYGPYLEYSWIYSASLLKYAGLSSFIQHAETAVQQASTKGEQQHLANMYQLKVSMKKRLQWDEAIELADQALKISKEQRIKEFGELLKELLATGKHFGLPASSDRRRRRQRTLSDDKKTNSHDEYALNEPSPNKKAKRSTKLRRKSSSSLSTESNQQHEFSYSSPLVINSDLNSTSTQSRTKSLVSPKKPIVFVPHSRKSGDSPTLKARHTKIKKDNGEEKRFSKQHSSSSNSGNKKKLTNVQQSTMSNVPSSSPPSNESFFMKVKTTPIHGVTTSSKTRAVPRTVYRSPSTNKSKQQNIRNNKSDDEYDYNIDKNKTFSPKSVSLSSPNITPSSNHRLVSPVVTSPTHLQPSVTSSTINEQPSMSSIVLLSQTALPVLTNYEQKQIVEGIINHRRGKQLTFEEAQAYALEKAIEIVLENHHYRMPYIQHEWFYDFCLKYPQIIFKYRSWFEHVKVDTVPLSGNVIEMKRWQLACILNAQIKSIQNGNKFNENNNDYNETMDDQDQDKHDRVATRSAKQYTK